MIDATWRHVGAMLAVDSSIAPGGVRALESMLVDAILLGTPHSHSALLAAPRREAPGHADRVARLAGGALPPTRCRSRTSRPAVGLSVRQVQQVVRARSADRRRSSSARSGCSGRARSCSPARRRRCRRGDGRGLRAPRTLRRRVPRSASASCPPPRAEPYPSGRDRQVGGLTLLLLPVPKAHDGAVERQDENPVHRSSRSSRCRCAALRCPAGSRRGPRRSRRADGRRPCRPRSPRWDCGGSASPCTSRRRSRRAAGRSR